MNTQMVILAILSYIEYTDGATINTIIQKNKSQISHLKKRGYLQHFGTSISIAVSYCSGG